MASRTKNLGLIKPDLDDNIDVTQLNANSDILDDKVQTNANNIESVKQELPKYLPLTGGTLTGDLQTENNIYKNSTNSTLIIGGGSDSDTGATLELCGNDRTDGVYALLRCGNNVLEVNNDGTTYINTIKNKEGTSLKLSSLNGNSHLEVNGDGNIYINAYKLQGVKGSEILVQSPNEGCNLALNDDGGAYVNGQKVMTVVNFENGYLRYSNDYIEYVTEVTVTRALGWITFPLPINNRINIQVSQTNRSGVSGGWTYYNVGADTSTGLNVYISAESMTVSVRVLGMR